MVPPPEPGQPRPRSRYRERHRANRQREFVDTARQIVTTEGLNALTMQRVTDELGSSTGGIYLYFKTKDALVAEMQREAVTTLSTSYLRGQEALAEVLAERKARAADAALAQAIATGLFWVDSEQTMPIDIELARRLFASAESTAENVEAAFVLPAALALLDAGRQRLDGAVDLGALEPANGMGRVLLLISSVTGALLTSKLVSWDAELFDGRQLATDLVHSLFRGWGASAKRLATAEGHLAAFAEGASLAPAVAPGES